MILIVGLGNPGKKYKKTRHNIGFMIIDKLKKHVSKKDAIFLKPTTYMNNSGKEVKSVIENCKLLGKDGCGQIENLLVVHDDIDLPLGTIRTSKNISSAGHKGIQSIIDELRTQNFTRVRIGIRPDHKVDTEKYVLEKFTKEEEKQLKQIIKEAVFKIKQLL